MNDGPVVFNLGPLSDDSMKQMASRTTSDTALADAMFVLCEGNPGAMTALGELTKESGEEALADLDHLQKMGVFGPDIWIGYKDVAKFDVKKFQEMIRDRSLKEKIEESKPS